MDSQKHVAVPISIECTLTVVVRSISNLSRISGNRAPNENTRPNSSIDKTYPIQKYNHFVL